MGRRNTIQRDLVLQAVTTLDNHPTPEQVYECVIARFPKISKSTVYRNLNILCDLGALVKIPLPGAADRIDHNLTPHCHAVCRNCGGVFDVHTAAPIPTAPECGDFEIEDVRMIFTGFCANCKQKIISKEKN